MGIPEDRKRFAAETLNNIQSLTKSQWSGRGSFLYAIDIGHSLPNGGSLIPLPEITYHVDMFKSMLESMQAGKNIFGFADFFPVLSPIVAQLDKVLMNELGDNEKTKLALPEDAFKALRANVFAMKQAFSSFLPSMMERGLLTNAVGNEQKRTLLGR